jgi:hypothetical protein
VRLAVALLGIAVVILVGIMRTQSNNVSGLESEVRDLNAKLGEKSKAEELQAKCAEQARNVFHEAAYSKAEFATYENHYAAKLNKCVMRVLYTDAHAPKAKAIWAYLNVVDAFDGKQYGKYAWHTETNKNFLIVPPFTCEVTLPTDEEKICHSMEEFEELMKVYMEDNQTKMSQNEVTSGKSMP